jgi:hypothetical protein
MVSSEYKTSYKEMKRTALAKEEGRRYTTAKPLARFIVALAL